MKKIVILMLVALMLFVAVPGFAAVNPGSQIDSADIFVGTGNFFSAGGTPLINSDVIDLKLVSSDGLEFLWGDSVIPMDGMFVRTTEEAGTVSGSFDIFDDGIIWDYEDETGLSIFPERDNFVSGDYQVTVSWDFGATNGRRVLYGGIDTDYPLSSGSYFAVGAIKVEEDPAFRVAVYKVESPEVVQDYFYPTPDDDDDLSYELLASFNDITSADMDLTFTLDQESEGYLVIAIQNWWKNELLLGKHVDVNLLGEDLALPGNAIEYSKVIYDLTDGRVGSGMSALVIPSEGDLLPDSMVPARRMYFPIKDLNGSFDIPLTYEDSNDATIRLEWDEDIPITSTGGGSCSIGSLPPSVFLLMLPILLMRKK